MDVFITDAYSRVSRAVVQSLGKSGLQIAIGGSEDRPNWLFSSRYCRKRVLYPSPQDEKDFVNFMLGEASQHQVLIPITDDCIWAISRHAQDFRQVTRILIPDHEAVQISLDKVRTCELARSLGVPVPETFQIKDLREIDDLANKLTYPAIVKWRNEMLTVIPRYRYVLSRQHFIETYRDMHKQSPFPLVQEIITGAGYGFFTLFNNDSEPVAIFCHKRLLEYPPTGGPSILCESVYEPDLIKSGIKLLKALKWHGPAMVEFKHDPRDGKFKILEINPRFWGSLPLAIGAGVDFPRMLFSTAAGENIGSPFLPYRIGIKCRFVFLEASNIRNLLLKRHFKSFLYTIYRALISLFDRETIIGDFQITDLRPTFQQFWLYLKRSKLGLAGRIKESIEKSPFNEKDELANPHRRSAILK